MGANVPRTSSLGRQSDHMVTDPICAKDGRFLRRGSGDPATELTRGGAAGGGKERMEIGERATG